MVVFLRGRGKNKKRHASSESKKRKNRWKRRGRRGERIRASGREKRRKPNTHVAVGIVPQMAGEVLQAGVETFPRVLDVLLIPLRV